MNDYIERTISDERDVPTEDNETERLIVIRTRDTKGAVSIKLAFGHQYILFTDTKHYQNHAIIAAELLHKIARNDCFVPKLEDA